MKNAGLGDDIWLLACHTQIVSPSSLPYPESAVTLD